MSHCEHIDKLPDDVGVLMEHIWQEATGSLDDTLAIPVENLKVEQVGTFCLVIYPFVNYLIVPDSHMLFSCRSEVFI